MEPRDEESRQETGQPLLLRNTGEKGDGTAGARSDASLLEKAVSEGATGAAVLAKHQSADRGCTRVSGPPVLHVGSRIQLSLPRVPFSLPEYVLSPITTARGNCQSITRIGNHKSDSNLCHLMHGPKLHRQFQKLRYGIATFTGIFVFDRTPPPPDQNQYRIRASDLLHAITSLIIFMAVVLYNKEVNYECLFSGITDWQAVQIIAVAPIVIGILGSILFVLYPSTGHGIGFPIGGLAIAMND